MSQEVRLIISKFIIIQTSACLLNGKTELFQINSDHLQTLRAKQPCIISISWKK